MLLLKERESTFGDKAKNALKTGAEGLIIYNHASGGNEVLSTEIDDGIDIPVTFASRGFILSL